MPFVTVQTIKGILDERQKKELLERLTDLMVDIEGRGDPAFRQWVWVKIDEQDARHWMLGGVTHAHEEIVKRFGAIPPDGMRK